MIEILNVALPFFGLILLGVLAGRIWAQSEDGLAWLNIFVLYFALPPLIFSVIAKTPIAKLANPLYVLATAGATSLCFLLMWFLARDMFKAPPQDAALMGTSAAYGNVGYMGLPLAVAFFGPQAAVPAALVFSFDITMLFLLTAVFAGLGSREQSRGTLILTIGKDVITHPFNIATILGVVASAAGWQPSGGLRTVIDMLSQAAAPAALFAMGVTVSLRGKPNINAALTTLSLIKLVLHPALALALVWLFVSAENYWVQVAVMMAALPTAGNAFILARKYNAYVAGSGAAVIGTTVMSVLTIPVLVYVLQQMI
jgi:malonate transporter and related proteins